MTWALYPFAGLQGTSGDATGTGTTARFDSVYDTVVYSGYVYVADYNNSKIKSVNLATAEVATVATMSTKPHSITEEGGVLYVGGLDGHLYSVTTGGTVTDLYTYPAIAGVGDYVATHLTGDGSGGVISTFPIGLGTVPMYHYDVSSTTVTTLTTGNLYRQVVISNGRLWCRDSAGSPSLFSWDYDATTPALSDQQSDSTNNDEMIGQRWGQTAEADEFLTATATNVVTRIRLNADATYDIVDSPYGPDDDDGAGAYLEPFEVNGQLIVARGELDCLSYLRNSGWYVGSIGMG
jgi:hypothetical protein